MKLILRGERWINASGSRCGKGRLAGANEHGNEPEGSIKGGEFLD